MMISEQLCRVVQIINRRRNILKKNGAIKALDPVFIDYNKWRKKHSKIIDVPMLKRKLAVELKELFDGKKYLCLNGLV